MTQEDGVSTPPGATATGATATAANGTPAQPHAPPDDLDLDAIVHLDEAWHQEGVEEGRAAGHARGHKEGKAVGKAKGFEIGCELGYYQACCRTWLAVLGRQTEEAGEAVVIADATTKERAIKTLQGIVTLVEEFPRHNAPDIDMADQVQRLRAKFRAAASMLGVSVAFALHKTRGGGEPEGLSF